MRRVRQYNTQNTTAATRINTAIQGKSRTSTNWNSPLRYIWLNGISENRIAQNCIHF